MLWLFLGHARAALITAVNIPLALMIAFIGMVATGTPANLISLGAVDFGIVVDSTVIMMENIFRHLAMPGAAQPHRAHPRRRAARSAPPMFFSTLIIGVAFIPLFTMTGVVGRDLLADGAHLRVRDRRRDRPGADADAGARARGFIQPSELATTSTTTG